MRVSVLVRSFLGLLVAGLFAGPAAAQPVLRGRVTDASTGEVLPSATVQVRGTYEGTITNEEGRYALRVDSLPVTLVVRFIGYETATRTVSADPSLRQNFQLSPSTVRMDEVVVTGDDFAENVMRKVVERKRRWWDSLRTYRVDAYNRFTISNDSGIVSIAESQTTAFWRRGDGTREVVTDRRQTANLDFDALPAAATVQNLYADDVDLFEHRLVGVTHPDAVDRYHFTLDSVRARNGRRVYDIRVEPERRTMVGFRGRVSVLDSVYALIDARLEPSRAVRFPRGVNLREVTFRQQFSSFGGPFWLPVDFRARFVVKIGLGSLLQVPTIHIDQVSRLSDYAVNVSVPDSLFETTQTVRVDSAAVARRDSLRADPLRVDTLATAGTVVPLSRAERRAYEDIDSTKTMEKAFEPTGPLAQMAEMGGDDGSGDGPDLVPDWASLTPRAWYNRVEGGHLGGRLELELGDRMTAAGHGAYNTAARDPFAWSYGGDARVRLGPSERWTLGASYDVGIRPRYAANAFTGRVSGWSRLVNSVVALGADGDNFDYYGTERIRATIAREIETIDLTARLQLTSEDVDPVSKTTDYDLLGKDVQLRPNGLVAEGELRSIGGRVVWGDAPDFFGVEPHHRVALAVEHSDPDLLDSDFDFTRFAVAAELRVPTFFQRRLRPNQLRLHVQGGTFTGTLPLVRAHAIGGMAETALGELETLDERAYQGDRTLGVFWEHHFRTVPFEWLGLYRLADRRLGISVHGGHARSWFSARSLFAAQLRNPFLSDSNGWHHEVGVSINGILGLLELTGTVRLDEPGFSLGIGTVSLF